MWEEAQEEDEDLYHPFCCPDCRINTNTKSMKACCERRMVVSNTLTQALALPDWQPPQRKLLLQPALHSTIRTECSFPRETTYVQNESPL